MKTNLTNIWKKCSWRNLQQTYVEQMSDLFVEHRYFNFQKKFQIQQWDIETSRFRKLSWLQ